MKLVSKRVIFVKVMVHSARTLVDPSMTREPAANALASGYAGVTVSLVPRDSGPYPFIGELDPATQMSAFSMSGGNHAAP